MDATLSPKQEKVLAAIKRHVEAYGEAPTMRQLIDELGYKQLSSVQRHIEALRAKGALPDRKAWSRGVKLHTSAQKHLPLVGTVECGPLSLAEEHIEGYIPYPVEKLQRPSARYFFVRAHGDSMNQSKLQIEEGDYLLVRQQQVASRGETIIALLGDDATCKVLDQTSDGLPKLMPKSSNPRHKPRILLEDFSILGVVEGAVKPRTESR